MKVATQTAQQQSLCTATAQIGFQDFKTFEPELELILYAIIMTQKPVLRA